MLCNQLATKHLPLALEATQVKYNTTHRITIFNGPQETKCKAVIVATTTKDAPYWRRTNTYCRFTICFLRSVWGQVRYPWRKVLHNMRSQCSRKSSIKVWNLCSISYQRRSQVIKDAQICAKCNKPLPFGLDLVNFKTSLYHQDCFRCTVCSVLLDVKSIAYEKNGLPYCESHYTGSSNDSGK
jgi:hypothetical protein